MEQLTIDDYYWEFNESLANWDDVLGQFEKCTVLAYIPKDALSPLECGIDGKGFRIGSKEWKYHTKLWRDYTVAIWNQIGFVDDAWEKACRKLQKYRDEGKPCEMELTRSDHFMRMNDFRPEHVTEYL
jgi:hypothetical protein